MTLEQLLLIAAVLYIILSFGMYFMLKKAQDKRAWFAFVPVANVYKMFSMNYDFFKGEGFRDGSVPPMKYRENRRYASLFLMLTYFIMTVAVFVIEELINPTDLTVEREPATNPIEFLFTGVGDVFAFLVMVVLSFFMFRMFVDRDTGEPVNAVVLGIFTVGAGLTFGLSIIVMMFYFGLSPRYKYDLDKVK